MKEIIFDITQEVDGGFVAKCLTESIFTQADTWEELRSQVKDAVEAYFFNQPKPEIIRLHFVDTQEPSHQRKRFPHIRV